MGLLSSVHFHLPMLSAYSQTFSAEKKRENIEQDSHFLWNERVSLAAWWIGLKADRIWHNCAAAVLIVHACRDLRTAASCRMHLPKLVE
jgi:hypothetical protein